MDNICGKYDVLLNGSTVGAAEITHESLKYVIECHSTYKTEKIMRLFCLSGEKYISVGVFFPTKNGAYLKRKFSKLELEEKEISSIRQFIIAEKDALPPLYASEAEPKQADITEPFESPESHTTSKSVYKKPSASFLENRDDTCTSRHSIGWQPEDTPASLFSDSELIKSCGRLQGAMKYTEGEYTYLAVPASPDKPFPMMPVFCFGSFETIKDAPYIVFKIKNGKLC